MTPPTTDPCPSARIVPWSAAVTSAHTRALPRPARGGAGPHPGPTSGDGAGGAGRVRRESAGLSLGILSAAAFGTSGAFASSLIGAGWSPAAAVLARITLAAVMLTVPALVQLRGRWPALRRAAPRVTVYGLAGVAGCQLFYFNAVARMPVGVALLLLPSSSREERRPRVSLVGGPTGFSAGWQTAF